MRIENWGRMNINQINNSYCMGSNIEIFTLQTVFNSLKGKKMRKACVYLLDIDSLEHKSESTHILELDQNSLNDQTLKLISEDDQMMKLISDLEEKTNKVCSDWHWITPRTVADIKAKKLNNSKPFYFSDAVVEVH